MFWLGGSAPSGPASLCRGLGISRPRRDRRSGGQRCRPQRRSGRASRKGREGGHAITGTEGEGRCQGPAGGARERCRGTARSREARALARQAEARAEQRAKDVEAKAEKRAKEADERAERAESAARKEAASAREAAAKAEMPRAKALPRARSSTPAPPGTPDTGRSRTWEAVRRAVEEIIQNVPPELIEEQLRDIAKAMKKAQGSRSSRSPSGDRTAFAAASRLPYVQQV